MKTLTIFITLIFITAFGASAQLLDRLGKRVENKVKQRVDRKVDKAVDKGLDKVEEKIDKSTKPDQTKSSKTQRSDSANPENHLISSDYDFIPGDELLFYDDYSNISLGDFPNRWNTNSSGKIVNISSHQGNWLLVPDNTISFPELGKALPENFTIEFDLYYPANSTRPPVTFGFSEVSNPAKQSIKGKKIFYFQISPSVGENIGYSTSLYSGKETTREWESNRNAGKVNHVSIAVNGQRIRLYVDTEKLFDLPRAIDFPTLRNNFHFRSADLIPKPKDGFYVSNFRIAKVTKDLKSALINDGKLSTVGIYFDSGSDNIKPVSYNLLNEIGVLIKNESSSIFDIVGHTDSDGSTQLNQNLSLQRAEAVCQYLIKNFNILKNNLNPIGKGSAEPLASNSTTEGKAQNRRVEFIKK